MTAGMLNVSHYLAVPSLNKKCTSTHYIGMRGGIAAAVISSDIKNYDRCCHQISRTAGLNFERN